LCIIDLRLFIERRGSPHAVLVHPDKSRLFRFENPFKNDNERSTFCFLFYMSDKMDTRSQKRRRTTPSSQNVLPRPASKFPLCAVVVSGCLFPFLRWADHFSLAVCSMFFLNCAFLPEPYRYKIRPQSLMDTQKPEARIAWAKHVTFPRYISQRRMGQFKDMTSLVSIDLSRTYIFSRSDNVVYRSLSFLKEFTNLKSLDLSRCRRLDGSGLIHLKGLHSLNRLFLQSCTNISGGRGLTHLKMLPIEKLCLGYCNLDNEDLLELRDFKCLRDLDLSWSKFDDAGLVNLYETKCRIIILLDCFRISDHGLEQFTASNSQCLVVGPQGYRKPEDPERLRVHLKNFLEIKSDRDPKNRIFARSDIEYGLFPPARTCHCLTLNSHCMG
jgi:hypothetical protein